MWGLNRFERPAWSTGILIPAGFICGISSAILIARGGAKTKRTAVVKEKLQAALEAEYSGIRGTNAIPQSSPQNNRQNASDAFVPPQEKAEIGHAPPIDDTDMIDEQMTVPRAPSGKEASS